MQGEIESKVTKLLPNQAKAMAANIDQNKPALMIFMRSAMEPFLL